MSITEPYIRPELPEDRLMKKLDEISTTLWWLAWWLFLIWLTVFL